MGIIKISLILSTGVLMSSLTIANEIGEFKLKNGLEAVKASSQINEKSKSKSVTLNYVSAAKIKSTPKAVKKTSALALPKVVNQHFTPSLTSDNKKLN
mgnify:CR=1 FL=1